MKCRICEQEFEQSRCCESDICRSCTDILFESTIREGSPDDVEVTTEEETRLQYEGSECRAYETRGE